MLFDRPKLLCEETKNDRRFFIEKYNKTIYLYITDIKYGKMFCVVWIANLCEAPDEIDVKSMNKGKPPRMHKDHCLLPEEGLTKVPEFRFVWEEGQDGASETLYVYGDDELHCRIENCFGEKPRGYNIYTKGVTSYGDELK